MGVKLTRAKRAAGRLALELKDKFRRRKTEKKHVVGVFKKGHVVVGPVGKVSVNGQDVFQAKFVAPRLGTQLAPYPDHITALAFESAGQQAVVAGMKKFMGIRGVFTPAAKIGINLRKLASPKDHLLVQVSLKKDNRNKGIKSMVFDCRVVGAEDNGRVFADGEFMLYIVPKKKA